jgi:hypothetical protein
VWRDLTVVEADLDVEADFKVRLYTP